METIMANPEHKIQPHFAHNRFANSPHEKLHDIIFSSCIMYLQKIFRKQARHQTHLAAWQSLNEHLAVDHSHLSHAQPEITWIGHASFLIKMGNFSVLTDPVFHGLTPLFPRHQAPGICYTKLPKVHAVLISHNHHDHLEKSTILYLARTQDPLFLVPQGDKQLLEQWGIKKISEYSWWEAHSLRHETDPHSLTLTFLPAHHWSGRWLFDTNKSLWGSWMISYNGYNCYFAGDTAYGTHFAAISQEFPNIHLALMPIAPCEPSQYLSKSHINAEEAGKAFLELKAQHLIPMHWGTFGFGIDHPLDPLHRLEAWWRRTITAENDTRLLIPLRVGQQLFLNTHTTSISQAQEKMVNATC
jgi:L-ascorbate metabolism protein UlaG (beta-lactamase superfamily)